jgi:FGFR1 oncogene partner
MQDEPNSVDLQQEAKELILKELEEKGVINYMRAKIKKSIIDIISSQSEAVQQKFDFDYMTPLHRLNKPKEIVLVCQLIKEFLKFYELEYTLPIFENESNIKENIKRETLLKEVKLENQKDNSKPVLLLLLLDKLNRKEELFNNQNKKNIDRYEMNSKSERDSVNSENKKIELNPTTFGSTNKSLEMAEPMTVDKFNNFNINEVYKNENEIKNEENNLNENKGQNDDKLKEIKDIKFEEIKNNEIKNIENLNDKNGAKNNNENLQEGIKEDIEGKEIKEKDENKISENMDSQSGQAFESTASNK